VFSAKSSLKPGRALHMPVHCPVHGVQPAQSSYLSTSNCCTKAHDVGQSRAEATRVGVDRFSKFQTFSSSIDINHVDRKCLDDPAGPGHHHTMGVIPGADGLGLLLAPPPQLLLSRRSIQCILVRRIHKLELDTMYLRGVQWRGDHYVRRRSP